MKKKTKTILYIVLGIFLLLISIFFYIGIFYEYTEFTFNFYVDETGEKLDGEIFSEASLLESTTNGKLTLPIENLNFSSFEFQTHYNGNDFTFEYEFLPEYLDLGGMDFIVYEEQLKPRNISLIFYDNNTGCKLNGEIYVDDVLLGEIEEGFFVLTQNDYNKKFVSNSTLYIFGRTDSCFGTNENLPFAEYWTIYDFQYALDNSEDEYFELNLNPRQPKYYLEMQGFVRPEEVGDYFEKNLKKYIKSNTEEDLDKISNFAIRYRSDNLLFGVSEYWQTPAETLEKGHGDCEDWAITTLSLMKEYNNSLSCYDILWETHISILCVLDSKIIIYDQGDTKYQIGLGSSDLTELEKKAKIRKMRNNYFDWYGLSPNERRMYALFNENELIIFEGDEDFVDWAIQLW